MSPPLPTATPTRPAPTRSSPIAASPQRCHVTFTVCPPHTGPPSPKTLLSPRTPVPLLSSGLLDGAPPTRLTVVTDSAALAPFCGTAPHCNLILYFCGRPPHTRLRFLLFHLIFLALLTGYYRRVPPSQTHATTQTTIKFMSLNTYVLSQTSVLVRVCLANRRLFSLAVVGPRLLSVFFA